MDLRSSPVWVCYRPREKGDIFPLSKTTVICASVPYYSVHRAHFWWRYKWHKWFVETMRVIQETRCWGEKKHKSTLKVKLDPSKLPLPPLNTGLPGVTKCYDLYPPPPIHIHNNLPTLLPQWQTEWWPSWDSWCSNYARNITSSPPTGNRHFITSPDPVSLRPEMDYSEIHEEINREMYAMNLLALS